MTAALKTKAADGLKKAFRDALARSPKVKAQERKRLDKAAQEGNLFVMKEIIARYPNEAVNWQDPEGSGLSPLHFAAIGRRGDIAEWLLTQGADTTLKDKDGLTALHYAAQAIDPDALYKLLNAGADIEARNNKGETPLMFAVVRKTQPDNIGVLVLADADIHAADNDGETPVSYARKNRMRDITNTIDWAFGTRIAHKAAAEEAAQAQKAAAIADAMQTMTSGSADTVAIKKPLRLKPNR